MSLRSWIYRFHKGHRKDRDHKRIPVVQQRPIIINSVPAAPLPNKAIEKASRRAEIDLVDKIMEFGRKSAEARELLATQALNGLKRG